MALRPTPLLDPLRPENPVAESVQEAMPRGMPRQQGQKNQPEPRKKEPKNQPTRAIGNDEAI